MTLDEAIKHCEEVATKNEKSIAYYTIQGDKEWLDECEKDCIECAKEHRQLAKWLLELKNYQRGIERIKELRDGFNQIPLSLEASVLESALELLGEEGRKALEQQPSEDCISREDAINTAIEAVDEWDGGCNINRATMICKAIKNLPSVTPSRPRGKWIHWTDDYKDYVTCSCCEYGEEGEVLLSDKTPFCPICGADMREGAE